MIFKLAFRNVLRNLPRLRPVLIIFVGTFVLLTTVNALLQYTQQSFSQSYVDFVSGDAAITEQSETRFTLFGSDTVLVGEYLEPPVIIDPAGLDARLVQLPEVAAHAFLVTAPTRVEVGDARVRRMAFGVQFSSYRRLFPDLNIISGDWPEDGPASALIQDHTYRQLFGTDDYSVHLGDSVLLAGATEDSFALREVTLSGVYRYPVTDEVLRSVILVDAQTVRSLAGYLSSRTTTVPPDDQEPLLSGSVDDFFGAEQGGGVEDQPTEDPSSSSMLDDIDALFATPVDEPDAPAADATTGAWNFALIRAAANYSTRSLIDSVQNELSSTHPYEVLDWRRSVGGNVLIVFYVRVLANIGILCVALAAVIITTNSLVLSVLERTKEIGTMRALGARKATVATILALETVLLVLGSAALGVLVGTILALILNAIGLPVDNQYLRILFGGGRIGATVSVPLVLSQLLIGLAFSGIALLYPLVRALRLSPIDAVNA